MNVLSKQQIVQRLAGISGWECTEDGHIQKIFIHETFLEAIAFVGQIADIAEAAKHHPDMHIYYNKVIIELWTHDVDGLTEKDFEVANNIDTII